LKETQKHLLQYDVYQGICRDPDFVSFDKTQLINGTVLSVDGAVIKKIPIFKKQSANMSSPVSYSYDCIRFLKPVLMVID